MTKVLYGNNPLCTVLPIFWLSRFGMRTVDDVDVTEENPHYSSRIIYPLRQFDGQNRREISKKKITKQTFESIEEKAELRLIWLLKESSVNLKRTIHFLKKLKNTISCWKAVFLNKVLCQPGTKSPYLIQVNASEIWPIAVKRTSNESVRL